METNLRAQNIILRKSLLEKEREIERLKLKVMELEDQVLSNELAIVNKPNQNRYMNMLSIFSNKIPILDDIISIFHSYSKTLAAHANFTFSSGSYWRHSNSENDLLNSVMNCFREFDIQLSLLVQLDLHSLIKISRQIRNTFKGLLHLLTLKTDADLNLEIELYRKKLYMLLSELGNFWSMDKLKLKYPLVLQSFISAGIFFSQDYAYMFAHCQIDVESSYYLDQNFLFRM
jgi:hypothetical protein